MGAGRSNSPAFKPGIHKPAAIITFTPLYHKNYMYSESCLCCMKKTYRFRIYPNKNQEVVMNRTLSTCRHLYNDSLAERKRQAELNRLKQSFDVFPWGKTEWINYYDQANQLPLSKTAFQKEVHSQVLQNTIKWIEEKVFIKPKGIRMTRIRRIRTDLEFLIQIFPSCHS